MQSLVYKMDTDKSQVRNQAKNRLIIVGYIISCASILILPIVFIPLGILIGIINIVGGETGHGIAQILLAIILGIIGASIGGAGFGIGR